MRNPNSPFKTLISVAVATAFLGACASSPKAPEGSSEVRAKLTQLQSDPQLASRAPVAIKDAETAVRAAEQPSKDKAHASHLVYIADRKVDIAAAQAEARLLDDERLKLGEKSQTARLDARTQEADSARQQAEALKRQIAELNAKETERGLIVTLGDVLFETGKSELKGTATANLAKLSAFLNQYPDRSLVIEGHTDNVGSDSYNQTLSQSRADSVKGFLIGQGIAANRITAYGKGESSPVASNDSSSSRQLNRRVEVIIANPPKQ